MVQFYLPDLDEADEAHRPKFKLEYTTFPVTALRPEPGPEPERGLEVEGEGEDEGEAGGAEAEAAEGVSAQKKKFAYPIPRRHLPRTLKNGTVHRSKKYAPYALEDLTVGAWAGLARRLGRAKGKGLRQRFREFMYMGGGEA